MSFDMTPIEGSSNLKSAGYDPDQNVLRVEFHGGNVYDYHGVTPEIHRAFSDSPSPGKYLHSIIKVGCPASKVPKEE